MYEIFEKLLNEKGVTAYRVAKETGIQNSTFTDWKKGKSIPKLEKLKKIADYFNVSVDYLIGVEKKMVSPADPLYELSDMDSELISVVRETNEKGYSADDIRLAIKMLELARNSGDK